MAMEAITRNGHNLHIGEFDCEGPYGIPILEKVTELPDVQWLPFNRANVEERRQQKGIHFFMDDYIFERCWKDPARYAQLLLSYGAVMSPDFSLFTDYPYAVQIYNHWRKHMLGAYWQRWGMKVIPSICWSDRDSFDWCFDGEPMHSIVAISTLGTQKSPFARRLFLEGFIEMLDRLEPIGIIWYGDIPCECSELCEDKKIHLNSVPAYHHTLAHDKKVR